ncbi:hypothetical protein HNR07_005883 [Nocardiopsis metallicus]|uniref:Uncharacterized protein n=1 Tax=Nocardiopsis metallicus TaxID=179819 RepID=A0A840WT08_9ACTN|nr:hypothetical protein [Nocardiopsis metallicus]
MSMYGLVLDQGRFWTPNPFPDAWEGFQGEQTWCFMASGRMADNIPELHYVEGYAFSGDFDFPIGHAWCARSDGRVVDPTWGDAGTAYYGVALTQAFRRLQHDPLLGQTSTLVQVAPSDLLEHGLPKTARAP